MKNTIRNMLYCLHDLFPLLFKISPEKIDVIVNDMYSKIRNEE